MAVSDEVEIVAEQVSALTGRVGALEARLAEVDRVTGRLEAAALTTARALQEISAHWDAVYEAMRRAEEPDVGQLDADLDDSRPRRRRP